MPVMSTSKGDRPAPRMAIVTPAVGMVAVLVALGIAIPVASVRGSSRLSPALVLAIGLVSGVGMTVGLRRAFAARAFRTERCAVVSPGGEPPLPRRIRKVGNRARFASHRFADTPFSTPEHFQPVGCSSANQRMRTIAVPRGRRAVQRTTMDRNPDWPNRGRWPAGP